MVRSKVLKTARKIKRYVAWRDDRSDWAGATVSGTGCGKKRWFFGVALRTCISLVRRGAPREGVPDTSLKGFRCGTSAAKLWWRPARNVTRSVQAVALVHNPRGWLGEIRPEDGMGFVGLGIEAHPALPTSFFRLSTCLTRSVPPVVPKGCERN